VADLSRTRKTMISVIIGLGAIDVAAAIYLALPLRAGAAQPAQVQQQAEEEYRQVSRTTVPLRGIDQKLSEAQKDDAAFISNRLPSRYSDVVAELGKLAAENHITITTVSYKTNPEKLAGIQDLEMHAGLDGQYLNLVKFINAVERDRIFFIIDSIGLTGQTGQRAGEVRLDMKLDTYLRGQSGQSTQS
jgi:type IV pilus assembly protein PilO